MSTAINLVKKGAKVDLTKGNTLLKYVIALGWDPQPSTSGDDFDLDATAFICGANGKLLTQDHMVFYNNLSDPAKALIHSGDNLTGDADGDDETIFLDLSKIDPAAERITIVVTIHDAVNRKQVFGQVKKAYIRILNGEDKKTELLKFDLEEDFSLETAVNFGEIYKKDGEWKFNATGEGTPSSLADFVAKFS